MKYYENKETGELLTRNEMIKQAIEEYDLFDSTNPLGIEEYYNVVIL